MVGGHDPMNTETDSRRDTGESTSALDHVAQCGAADISSGHSDLDSRGFRDGAVGLANAFG